MDTEVQFDEAAFALALDDLRIELNQISQIAGIACYHSDDATYIGEYAFSQEFTVLGQKPLVMLTAQKDGDATDVSVSVHGTTFHSFTRPAGRAGREMVERLFAVGIASGIESGR